LVGYVKGVISPPNSRVAEMIVKITPTQFLESMNAINELLISAHSSRHTFLDNFLAVFTLQLSPLFLDTHYEKVREANPSSVNYLLKKIRRDRR
jgi:Golgin subfamily A member 7/ERF4 family